MPKKKVSNLRKTLASLYIFVGLVAIITALNYADYKWFDQLNPFYTDPQPAANISQANQDLLNKKFNENTKVVDSPKIGGNSTTESN